MWTDELESIMEFMQLRTWGLVNWNVILTLKLLGLTNKLTESSTRWVLWLVHVRTMHFFSSLPFLVWVGTDAVGDPVVVIKKWLIGKYVMKRFHYLNQKICFWKIRWKRSSRVRIPSSSSTWSTPSKTETETLSSISLAMTRRMSLNRYSVAWCPAFGALGTLEVGEQLQQYCVGLHNKYCPPSNETRVKLNIFK